MSEETITQYITNVLQRDPEPGEAEGWAALIDSGNQTLGGVRQAIIDGAEAVNDVYPVILAYQAIYGRVPEAGGLDYWVNRYRDVQDLDDPETPTQNEAMIAVLRAFVDPERTPEFVDRYGSNPNAAQFVTAAYTNVLDRPFDEEGLNYWTNRYNEVLAELEVANPDWSSSELALEVRAIILEQFVSSAEYVEAAAAGIDGYLDAVAQGEDGAYDGTLWSFDPDDTTGELFVLTPTTNTFVGGDRDDVFQADAEGTAVLPIQTLNSTDNLDGGGGWNTLNAQLVDPNVTPAGLSNIQEINISSAPGIVGGLLGFVEPRLNAINADSVEVLGFSALHNNVAIDNLDAGLTDINISNSGPWFIGGSPDIDVNLIGDHLGGEEDALNINLVNADVILDVDHDRSAEEQGYEIINIDSAGSDPDGNALQLEGSAFAAHTINVTGGSDLDMSGSTALDLDNLRTFTAAALTASLVADFVGAAENEDGELQTVEIIGAEGDNDLSFNGTAGNLVIETFDGDDDITVTNHEGDIDLSTGAGDDEISVLGHEGDIDLSTGAGDDEVTLNAARFGPDATGEGITIDMGEGDNTLEVLIPSLPDDQKDALVDGDVALMSFGDADIQNVQTLVVDGDLKANAAGLGPVGTIVIDLAGLADIETVKFDGEVLVGGADFIIANAPDELTLTFENDLRVGSSGSLNNEDTEDLTINAEVGATIAGTLDFEDVEDLTLNIGNAEASGQQAFNFQPSAVFLGDDLETLTVNLIDGSGDTDGANFVGPVTLTSSAQSLETVVVTGSENSNFTMSFHADATPEISSIDLSGFAGDATVSVFDSTYTVEGPITVTIGAGSLDYDEGVADQRETFVFTDGDFGTVKIASFETDNTADAADSDRIDLTGLGVTSLGQLDIDVAGQDVTINSDLFEGTIEVTVVGDTADFTDYLIF